MPTTQDDPEGQNPEAENRQESIWPCPPPRPTHSVMCRMGEKREGQILLRGIQFSVLEYQRSLLLMKELHKYLTVLDPDSLLKV